jgi:hypothetical protein
LDFEVQIEEGAKKKRRTQNTTAIPVLFKMFETSKLVPGFRIWFDLDDLKSQKGGEGGGGEKNIQVVCIVLETSYPNPRTS